MSEREYPPEELPPHDQLADDKDELGWDREKHGRMVDFADVASVETVPYNPDADPFLRGEG